MLHLQRRCSVLMSGFFTNTTITVNCLQVTNPSPSLNVHRKQSLKTPILRRKTKRHEKHLLLIFLFDTTCFLSPSTLLPHTSFCSCCDNTYFLQYFLGETMYCSKEYVCKCFLQRSAHCYDPVFGSTKPPKPFCCVTHQQPIKAITMIFTDR